MKKELILKEIYRQNKHWSDAAAFFSDLQKIKHKRKLFFELLPYLEKKQIVSVAGLRRTGKTILLKQLIRELLKENKAASVLFLTFDEAIFPKGVSLADYLDAYLESAAPENGKLFVFLDEIQYAAKWQHIIKRYWDTEPRMKFVISGSSSLFIRKKTTESLAGRIYEFILPVLSFEEYLELRGETALLDGYQKHSMGINDEIVGAKEKQNFARQSGAKMEKAFTRYLRFGQFPEIAAEENEETIKKYLTDAIYKKTIEYDIPRIFGVERVDELKFLFQVAVNEVGSVVEIGNIAGEVGIDEKTVKKYFSYFEESFLARLLYNFSKSIRKSRRLQKKIYLGSANFYSAFHDWKNEAESAAPEGFLAENYCFYLLEKEFKYLSFYRVRREEIDFMGADDRRDNKSRRYFEVKYRNDLNSREFKFISKMAKKNQSAFRIISKNKLAIESGYSIVPIWLLR
jgi:predicted AAA+ superfamily ATPase